MPVGNVDYTQLIQLSTQYKKLLDEMFQPLKSLFSFSFCWFSEVGRNGLAYFLSNNPDLMQFYWQNKHYLDDPHFIDHQHVINSSQIWSNFQNNNYQSFFLDSLRNIYGIEDGISIIKTNRYGYKIFSFATDINKYKFFNKIMNNRLAFEHSIEYVCNEIPGILEQAKKLSVDLGALKGRKFYTQQGIIERDSATILV